MTADALIDGWQEAWTAKDPSRFADVCASGIQYEDPLTGQPLNGISALAAHADRLWAGFPDARLERTGERLYNERFVAAPCKALGTHRAPLEGLPATNRFVVVHCIFYCELQHELLLRVRAFFDVYDAATQLGVLPARGTLGERALLMLRGFGLRNARNT
ncbi:MAG TPA: ester cyclase [Solirubrobacteraceae bacterium]|nr:ester cyclase [Solirubrobacteraceae bacterium]